MRSTQDGWLQVGLSFFCLLRPVPLNIAFALTGIALFVAALALCHLTLALSGVLCPLRLAICALALVLALPLVPGVAVGGRETAAACERRR